MTFFPGKTPVYFEYPGLKSENVENRRQTGWKEKKQNIGMTLPWGLALQRARWRIIRAGNHRLQLYGRGAGEHLRPSFRPFFLRESSIISRMLFLCCLLVNSGLNFPKDELDYPESHAACCSSSWASSPCCAYLILFLPPADLTLWLNRGFVQFVVTACSIAISFFPDEFDRAATHWLNPDHHGADELHWPTDISQDIIPVGCHSHNDYWRRVPLFSALQAGCISVEADVWFIDQGHLDHPRDLYVGHTTSSLTPQRTLRSIYVDPLMKILDRQNPITPFHSIIDRPPNGVFDTNPAQSLILVIDFKTDGAMTWPQVVQNLAPLRERGYLTYFNGVEVINGPVTVVGTGNTPFDLVIANSTYRDIFFDAPLHYLTEDATSTPISKENIKTKQSDNDNNNLGQGRSGASPDITPDAFDSTNSFYASTSFKNSIGSPQPFHLTPQQMDSLRAQVQSAHRRGLKVRYWGLPSWPRNLRNHLWNVLIFEGVDILNVDDLKGATKKEWTTNALGWW